jgi:GNAT superfamily N-acetyltransferase
MSLQYHVRPFSREVEAAYERLFSGDSNDKNAALLQWRFRNAPHGSGHFATAEDPGRGGKIVGMIGLIATRLRTPDGVVPAVQAVDTMVDAAYRGKGLFTSLGGAAHGATLAWGFPNDNAAPGWFGKLGWQNLGTVPFMVRPIRSGYFLRRIAAGLSRVNIRMVSSPRAAAGRYVRVERFDERATDLWRAFSEQAGCAVDRDADFLNWRLIDRPDAPYISVAEQGDDGAWRAFVSSCVLDKHDGRICYVMEAMARPGDHKALARLIRHQVATAADAGADAALAWCPPGAPNRAAYRAAGFLPFPDRFRPVQIHFGGRALVPALEPLLQSPPGWYLSYLDSDTV